MKSIVFLLFFSFCNLLVFGQDEKAHLDQIKVYQLKIDSINFQIAQLKKELDHFSKLRDSENEKLRLHTLKGVNGGKGIITKAKVRNDLGKFRLMETPGGEILTNFPINSEITVLALVDKHYKIRYKGLVGYVTASYLLLEPEVVRLFKEVTPLSEEEEFSQSKNKIGNNYSTRSSAKNNNRVTKKKPLKYNGPVHVKGHWRTTKSGKRVYVRPHTRSR